MTTNTVRLEIINLVSKKLPRPQLLAVLALCRQSITPVLPEHLPDWMPISAAANLLYLNAGHLRRLAKSRVPLLIERRITTRGQTSWYIQSAAVHALACATLRQPSAIQAANCACLAKSACLESHALQKDQNA